MIEERYRADREWIERELIVGDRSFVSRMSDISRLDDEAPAWSMWWRSYLRGARVKFDGHAIGNVSILDLFCGCGGLTLGAQEAVRTVGLRPWVRLAVDVDEEALAVYVANFAPNRTLRADVSSLVDFQVSGWGEEARFAYPPELLHPKLRAAKGSVDLVVAGPPCEGHSNLNNRTRRADPRNLLYLDAIAVGVAIGATAIVLENVPDIVNDRSRLVETAVGLLKGCDYETTQGVLAADLLGLAQTRKRFFLAASRAGVVPLEEIARAMAKEPASTVRWAIEDLLDTEKDSILDVPAALSPENRRRIDYLFDNDLYDLPDHMRPACHRNGHTYPSVYGRLRWDEPAGTITTGFVSPGRGRFVHPERRRTLTAHEAARLQGFPDWFVWCPSDRKAPSRTQLAKWIGDAVPPLLGYTAVVSVLPSFLR
jgi:DNA (cytosine-5)-methyltransferase 1